MTKRPTPRPENAWNAAPFLRPRRGGGEASDSSLVSRGRSREAGSERHVAHDPPRAVRLAFPHGQIGSLARDRLAVGAEHGRPAATPLIDSGALAVPPTTIRS